eukprot:CAMPEP_0194299772 /NCGR_PEP_ID=MMETSP0169-20130528/60896_1 /TAXON_ID=218684 /ORGANISM="Corethron pennatum, Strain L29A3" /LENGTH=151 /DNA_ID=CAMNT_0039049883 /DNA_START=821 /DNA_END=1276 /DNA_ORIENTATION=+
MSPTFCGRIHGTVHFLWVPRRRVTLQPGRSTLRSRWAGSFKNSTSSQRPRVEGRSWSRRPWWENRWGRTNSGARLVPPLSSARAWYPVAPISVPSRAGSRWKDGTGHGDEGAHRDMGVRASSTAHRRAPPGRSRCTGSMAALVYPRASALA